MFSLWGKSNCAQNEAGLLIGKREVTSSGLVRMQQVTKSETILTGVA